VRRSFLNATGGLEVGSEHNDLLATGADVHEQAFGDLVDHLRAKRRTDEFALDGASSRAFQMARGLWPQGHADVRESESPYVDLDAVRKAGEEYLDSLSSNTRYQIRRSIRRYTERFGPPEHRVAESAAERLHWLDDLVALHEAHWRDQGSSGAFTDGRLEFHRSLIRAATSRADDDELRVDISRLRFGSTTIGLLYHLVFRGRVSFYQSGLDYADDPRLKPGLVSHAFAIHHFAEQGLREYDFLGGETDPVRYKRSLANARRPLVWARFQEPSAKMSALEMARWIRRRIKP